MLYTTMQTTMNRGQLKTDLQQSARVAMDQMVREIRMAGYDPSGVIPLVALPPKSAIRAATSGCLSFVADVTGSGTASQISYILQNEQTGNTVSDGNCPGSTCTLRRKAENWSSGAFSGGGGLQAQAEALFLLNFTYYDFYNQVIAPHTTTTKGCPPGTTDQSLTQLDYWQVQQIRRVAVTIQTRDSRPSIPLEFYKLTSDVRLRNR